MKALVKEAGQSLRVEDVAKPKLSAGCSIIKVELAGICRTDLYVAKDIIPHAHRVVIGHEFTGRIEQSWKNEFKIGTLVAVNPLQPDQRFLGIDLDGCFAEYIKVDNRLIHPLSSLQDYRLAAYVEPIAASLAPLKSGLLKGTGRCGIYGKDRIAKLLLAILKNENLTFELIDPELAVTGGENYDLIIETVTTKDSLANIIQLLKPRGSLIIKSRYPTDVNINIYEFVKKEIKMEAVYYHDFTYAIAYAEKHPEIFTGVFGQTYDLSDWPAAFNDNLTGNKKVFLKP
jgi:L-iditol 2-dehydrogenase